MGLQLDYDITGLRGAEYNPRYIDPDDLEALRESIRTLGLVKPLIVRGNVLVAGHQRTKALRSMGITHAPCFILGADTTTYDEVRFNQLHNGTDLDCGDERARVSGVLELGWNTVDASRVSGNTRGRMVPVRAEIARLILKYGPWGGCVATQSGEIIHCAQYALAAMLTRSPLTVYVVANERADEYRLRLSKTYGVFSYANLKRDTFIQSFAQMFRLRDTESGREQRSTLYEQHVIPWLAKHPRARGLDFGSGQGDYAAALRAKGHNLLDLEFFRRAKGVMAIDVRAVNRMIDGCISSISEHGLFDYVVCDSVFNSVDGLDAEAAVMAVIIMLTRTGGELFFSGRRTESITNFMNMTKTTERTRRVEFLDKDGFTALYRKGRWFYQKFHNDADIAAMCEKYGLEVVKRTCSRTSWQVHARKVADLPSETYRKAVDYEFDLPVSDTRRLGRNKDVWAAYAGAVHV